MFDPSSKNRYRQEILRLAKGSIDLPPSQRTPWLEDQLRASLLSDPIHENAGWVLFCSSNAFSILSEEGYKKPLLLCDSAEEILLFIAKAAILTDLSEETQKLQNTVSEGKSYTITAQDIRACEKAETLSEDLQNRREYLLKEVQFLDEKIAYLRTPTCGF